MLGPYGASLRLLAKDCGYTKGNSLLGDACCSQCGKKGGVNKKRHRARWLR